MHPVLSTWHHESEAPTFYQGNSSSSSLPIPTPEGVNLVPSRSILGPMLFLIYVTNLPDSVLTSHVRPCLPMAQRYILYKLSLRKMLCTYKLTCLLASWQTSDSHLQLAGHGIFISYKSCSLAVKSGYFSQEPVK